MTFVSLSELRYITSEWNLCHFLTSRKSLKKKENSLFTWRFCRRRPLVAWAPLFFFQQQPGLNELFSFRLHQRSWCEEAHSNMVSNTVESSLPYLVTSTKADLCVEKSEALILNMVSFYPLQAIVFVVEQTECSLSVCYKHYLKSVTLGD